MSPHLADTGEGGRRCKYIEEILHIGPPINSDIWVGDVVHDPLHGADPGGVATPSGEIAHRKTPPLPSGRDMELLSVRGVHVGRGDKENGDIQWEATEKGGAVHNHRAYNVPLPGCREIPGGKGIKVMEVESWTAVCGSEGGRRYVRGGGIGG